MSDHPVKCRGCRGSGYQPGPKVVENVNGRLTEYRTVKPCGHDHWNDDPGHDPQRDDPVAEKSPPAIERRSAGYELGQHDLWVMSGGQLGKQHPNARKETA